MDIKQIEKLMAAMEESRIKRIVLKKEDYEIEIERECATYAPAPLYQHQPISSPQPHPIESKPASIPSLVVSHEGGEKAVGLFVTSPMVGTFYASPSPDDPAFAKVGDPVTEETVVCIIEAMKVMNEVKSGVRGTIAEILIKNGEPVEFGTQIMRVNPA